MSRLATQAERLKLARLLGIAEYRLDFLASLDSAALRVLREQATGLLFDADRELLQRIVTASRLMPTALTALIAEKALGALLCARTAGLMPADRAAEISQRLPVKFLADTCERLDPRRVRELIARLPVECIVDVAVELSQRGEYVTMARFVDFLSDEMLRSVIAALKDDAALLHVGFFLEDQRRLDQILGLLPEARLRSIVLLATDESRDLWPETLSLMTQVNPQWRRRMAELAVAQGDAAIATMLHVTHRQRLWAQMLPIVGAMGPDAQRRVFEVVAAQSESALAGMVKAADEEQLWPQLLALLPQMNEAVIKRMAALARKLAPERADSLLKEAQSRGFRERLESLRESFQRLG